MPKSKNPSLEDTFEKLESLVDKLDGDIPLEEALAAFEQGTKLIKNAQEVLLEAEQKVAMLTESEDGDIEEELLDEDDE